MTTKIKTDDVINALEEAVALKGADYTYPTNDFSGCFYADPASPVENPKPSCIVGFVLAKVAPEVFANLAEFEAKWETSRVILDVYTPRSNDEGVEDFGTLEFEDEKVVQALADAQAAQDTGENWGRARTAFFRVLEPTDD